MTVPDVAVTAVVLFASADFFVVDHDVSRLDERKLGAAVLLMLDAIAAT